MQTTYSLLILIKGLTRNEFKNREVLKKDRLHLGNGAYLSRKVNRGWYVSTRFLCTGNLQFFQD